MTPFDVIAGLKTTILIVGLQVATLWSPTTSVVGQGNLRRYLLKIRIVLEWVSSYAALFFLRTTCASSSLSLSSSELSSSELFS